MPIVSHTWAELRAKGPPQWIIKGIIPANSVGLVWGPSGAAKSFTLLSMLLSSAARLVRPDDDGLNWCAFETMPCAGAYVGLEGSLQDWGLRQLAWATMHEVTAEPDVPFISDGQDAHHLEHRLTGGRRGVEALLMQVEVDLECVELG